jgi:NADH-quinone oxidoreductase subunit G
LYSAIDNEFSGNMIDVCPVGAYTNSVLNREFGSISRLMRTENVQHQDVVKTTVWMFGNDSACGEEKMYHEVEEFCNSCRFDHKEVTDWVIEGPKIRQRLVINQNNYTRELDTVHIATKRNFEGREQDRKKISMPAFPLKEQEENFKQGNL